MRPENIPDLLLTLVILQGVLIVLVFLGLIVVGSKVSSLWHMMRNTSDVLEDILDELRRRNKKAD